MNSGLKAQASEVLAVESERSGVAQLLQYTVKDRGRIERDYQALE